MSSDQAGETAYQNGQRAAAINIPADANPHREGSDAHAQWAEGHESVAAAVEAGQSEDT